MQTFYDGGARISPSNLFPRAGTGAVPAPPLHFLGTKRKPGSEGVALVIVLFAVALVSIVVLAYFNLAILNRNISFSSAGDARANIGFQQVPP